MESGLLVHSHTTPNTRLSHCSTTSSARPGPAYQLQENWRLVAHMSVCAQTCVLELFVDNLTTHPALPPSRCAGAAEQTLMKPHPVSVHGDKARSLPRDGLGLCIFASCTLFSLLRPAFSTSLAVFSYTFRGSACLPCTRFPPRSPRRHRHSSPFARD